uniref:Molybdopterin molybdenumtransferase MoeA n=1 Tax=Staphylothermus marinus TaxID=2280 RepID=A0A7C4H907_STAMA
MFKNCFENIQEKKYSYIDLKDLYDLLRTSISRVDIVKINVKESVGYVLAEEIKAKYNRPLYDISHLDGFAVKYDDLIHASKYNPVKLRIVNGIDPRRAGEYELKNGEAVFVETGYPVPVNADVVIPVEDVTVDHNYIIVDKLYSRYANVFREGSDFRENESVLKYGIRITPLIQKVLIDMGYETIRVYRKPRISIINVGDELIDDFYKPESDKLPVSTMWIDKHVFEYYGSEIIETSIVPDDSTAIVNKVFESIDKSDLIVTIGGASLGPRDLVWTSLYRELKPSKWWRGVKTLPGRVTSGLIVNGKLVLIQPGLPQSSIVSLIFIATPVVEYMQGLDLKPAYSCIEVCLAEDIVFSKFIDFYRVVFLNVVENKAYVVKNLGSYYLNPMVNSNSFTILEPGFERIRENSVVNACFYPPLFQPVRNRVLV